VARRSDRLGLGPPPVAAPARQDARQFSGIPASVPAARRHVRDLLVGWGLRQLEEAGAVLVTELVTNAVLHAASDVEVELLDGGDGQVVLVVADRSPFLPVPRRSGREAATGRGMWLLDHFSSERGVEQLDGGKRVWAVLCSEVQGATEGSGSRLAALLDEREPD
jgi:serine/threonine-protein kinase RsbW